MDKKLNNIAVHLWCSGNAFSSSWSSSSSLHHVQRRGRPWLWWSRKVQYSFNLKEWNSSFRYLLLRPYQIIFIKTDSRKFLLSMYLVFLLSMYLVFLLSMYLVFLLSMYLFKFQYDLSYSTNWPIVLCRDGSSQVWYGGGGGGGGGAHRALIMVQGGTIDQVRNH